MPVRYTTVSSAANDFFLCRRIATANLSAAARACLMMPAVSGEDDGVSISSAVGTRTSSPTPIGMSAANSSTQFSLMSTSVNAPATSLISNITFVPGNRSLSWRMRRMIDLMMGYKQPPCATLSMCPFGSSPSATFDR